MNLPYSRANNQRNGHLKRRYLARRLEILRAAGKEFRVRGFAETGMRDIAAAAALSPANLYNYFAGKRSEEHTSELQSRLHLVCRLLLEKKKKKKIMYRFS